MRKLYSILFLMALASCSKNETETPAENKAPLAFTVSVSELTTRSTQLNWLEAKDPEGKKVTYSVELNNQTIASNLSATGYKLENLAANAAYSGKIIASDPAGNKTSGAFSFSTTDHPQPSDFILSAENVTSKSISLSWSASTLPDNSPVTYDVLVDSVLAAPSLTTTRYEIYTLAPKKTYQFKVVAKAASGKSREKVIPVETKENALPAAFTITQNAYGFSYITFTCNKTTDTDNDPLTYYLVRNGVETQLLATNPAANFSYTLKKLSAATNYTLAVKVKDGRGGETTSNTLTFKTNAAPESNFAITAKSEGDMVALEWTTRTQEQFDRGQSYYYTDGVAKSMNNAQVSYTALADGSVAVKALVPGTDFPSEIAKWVKVSLYWGVNNSPFTTQSTEIAFTRTKSTGYIITKDAGGVHKLNFTYKVN